MAVTTACIAGEEACRQWDAGRMAGRRIGTRTTPFGDSGDIFLVEGGGRPFYLLSRYHRDRGKSSPGAINSRANMYALKDLGAERVLGWGPGGAIRHDVHVGELVILTDLIDLTSHRAKTFFEDSPLGFLRQFPVFCPTLRPAAADALAEINLPYHDSGTAAVCEGPRLETPAEIRMLATVGAHIVTHAFVPEVFLAKELQLCYAAICYVVNYAETGSRHRPFVPGDLFGGLTSSSDAERLAAAVGAMGPLAQRVAAAMADGENTCECSRTMAAHIRQYDLPQDWRAWFS